MNDTHCRYAGRIQPRTLDARHLEECTSDECRGCLPCPMDHCRVCGIAHAEQTCAACVGSVRDDLAEIVRLYASLPEEVEVKGVDHEALSLLGPVADPEARGHLRASVAAGRLPADAEGFVPRDKAGNELPDPSPLWTLGTWAMMYRDAFEHTEPSDVATVAGEARYLDAHLTEAGNEPWVPFEQFAQDVRACVAHMERVLHDGEQIERGAPCPTCAKPLQRRYGGSAKDDRWVCLTRWCEVDGYTTAQYKGWVQDDALKRADRLTAADMVRRFVSDAGVPLVKAGEVRVWGSRGLVRKRGKSEQQVTLYDVADVALRIEARRADSAA